MDYQKLFYITGVVFFICVSILAIAMMVMMFGGLFFD